MIRTSSATPPASDRQKRVLRYRLAMLDQDAFYDSYIKPFRLVERLGLECGYEKSFKLVHGHLLRNRYLLGIEKAILDRQQLESICQQMQMPRQFVDALFANLSDANIVLLGFEEGIGKCTYKIYLEFWDRIRRQVAATQPPYAPMTMFRGFKWNAMDRHEAVLTDYVCYPLVGIDEIVERIGQLGALCKDGIVFDVAKEIIVEAANLASDQSFIYLEASEDGNPRRSFDINLYPANQHLNFIDSAVAKLFDFYGIARKEHSLLYEQVGSRPLGHISGGIDRSGKDFFTVYYENQPHQ